MSLKSDEVFGLITKFLASGDGKPGVDKVQAVF